MNTTYITENDKNGKARYYRVTDGKKKVCSKAEYDAHTLVESNDTEAVTADVIYEAEENAQIAFEETEVSLTEVQGDFIDVSPDEYTASDEKPGEEHASPEDFYEIVKGIVTETGSKHYQKMYLQTCKKCATINYRNCTVCSLLFNKQGAVSEIKFMGTTADTRKKMSIYKLEHLSDLSAYKDKITEQIEYIDSWYLNASKKNDKAS